LTVWGSFSRQAGEPHEAAASVSGTPAPNLGGKAAAVDNSSGAPGSAATPPAALPQTAAPVESSPAPEQAAPASPQTEIGPAFLVLVQARQDSWVEITADGKEVMQDTLTATAEKSVEAHKEVVIRAGNVGGLEFSFNGRRLPVQGDHNEVRVLTFDSNGLQNPASKRPRPDTRGRRPEV
jgi:hypothetical protein